MSDNRSLPQIMDSIGGILSNIIDTKLIDCPEHPGQHKATLFCEPHKFAGIWECDVTNEGISDTHDHDLAIEEGRADREVEEIIGYFPTPQQIDAGTDHDEIYHVYICGGEEGCGVQLEGDPDVDAADDAADRAYDEYRDSQL